MSVTKQEKKLIEVLRSIQWGTIKFIEVSNGEPNYLVVEKRIKI